MANQAAIRFVKNLIAAFCQFKTTAETRDIYIEKLSKWYLSEDQWAKALSKIISESPNGNLLPQLGQIYPYLTAEHTEIQKIGENLGWMTFKLHDKPIAVRIINKDGEWLNAPISIKNIKGQKIILQKHPFQEPKLPDGALFIRTWPDKQAYRDEEEKPIEFKQAKTEPERIGELFGVPF